MEGRPPVAPVSPCRRRGRDAATELLSILSCELSLLLEFLRVGQQLANRARLISDTLAPILAIFRIGKVLEGPDTEEIILDLLDAPRSTVFDEVLHGVETLVNAAPFFRRGAYLFPEVLHDLSVVIPNKGHYTLNYSPVKGVVCQNL